MTRAAVYGSAAWRAWKHDHHWGGAGYVRSGLTAYWNSTQQTGAESSVIEIVGGLNAAHTASPTFDTATKLWSYNGTTQRSGTSLLAALETSGVFTLETVMALVSTTPNDGFAAGFASSAGAVEILVEAVNTTAAAVVTGAAGNSFGSLPLNTVTHLAITSDGAHTQLYRNGVAAGSPIAITPQAPVALLAGFGNVPGGSHWCTCKAGWMRWYATTCLSQGQVAQNYAQAKTLFPALP